MQSNQNQIQQIIGIIGKSLSGNLSQAEQHGLDSWLALSDDNRKLFNEVGNPAYRHEQLQEMATYTDEETALADFFLKHRPAKKTKLWPRIAGIAAAVIGLAVCVYFFTTPRHPDTSLSSRANAKDLNDIAPGGNRATLTFANGNKINLSDKKNGVIVGDALKYDDNTLVIQSDSEGPKDRSLETRDDKVSEAITATTPKGGTYSIILQDGTKVWLNADSKLEFLSNYRNKHQRIVKLIAGEAYFEVAKNRAKPFIVESNGQCTEVLGTHFNISAYGDDAGIRTTLLEGSIRVSPTLSSRARTLSSRATAKDLDPSELGMTKETDGVVLKPHQQSLLTNNKITVERVDASEAIAWKNGKFLFAKEDIKSIMNKIARWYDVDIAYEGNVQNKALLGSVSRFKNVSEVLDMLSATKAVKFRIDGRKITVMPYK